MRWSCLLAAVLVAACSPAGVAPLAAPAFPQPVVVAEPTSSAFARQILVPTPTLAPAASATPAPTEKQLAPAVAPAPARAATPYDPPFLTPVIEKDYPDPGLLIAAGAFYAFATNANGRNVQASISTDLVHWRDLPDALPALPSWAQPGFTWAPEVTQAGSTYVMYFTARHAPSGRQCVGAATSSSPAGPFRPRGDVPLVCEPQFGGSIDP